MKALILFGSPHKNGNTSFLVDTFLKYFNGDYEIIYLYDAKISPCLDCGKCKKNLGCSINDTFLKLISDSYDILVIASPIHMSNLPAPFWSIIGRTNFTYYNKTELNQKLKLTKKIGVILFTAGGYACKQLFEKSNDYLPLKQAKYIFYKLNVDFSNDRYVLADKTDDNDIRQDIKLVDRISKIAKNL